MFYKVIKDGKIIDLLNHPIWIKYQAKHDVMLTCPINEAEGVMSSDGEYFWHVDVFPSIKNKMLIQCHWLRLMCMNTTN